jgi:hypothetical protein
MTKTPTSYLAFGLMTANKERIEMNTIELTLNDETAEVMRRLTVLTGLTSGEIVRRQLALFEADCHEVLALASTHPELRDEAANLIISFGPEPVLESIKRIAPPGYLTLSESFELLVRKAAGAVTKH